MYKVNSNRSLNNLNLSFMNEMFNVKAPNVGHILFECPIVDTIRKKRWQNVLREMSTGMTNLF